MKMMPIYAATAAVLLSTTAMAQTAAPTGTMGTTATAATGMAPTFVTRQMADQHMASNLIGTAVRGPADENLGEINDLLIDRSGNVAAVVIGVGGFLGIGEKDVAVPFQTVEMTRVDGKNRLVLRKTKDELKNAPTFTEMDATPSTTGSVNRPATPPATTAPVAR
ncbi:MULTISPECIES: PRC-barrel domain-containing protein [Xanthobacter]|uniref:PRC-barrel domain-containing protein n=1 Tax=Xanthobacter TaxID=279 RepID=UPI001E33405F|nr:MULTISPECIES: PRC-barrel domain-containing protein [Xanthobacter]UDQ89648.1 PRC-barrel domain-containing protein [Xanthobacter autotrophicus]UJX47421.1 PRC-barrel domain containing protein [Xanthobacter sp. YC-JY1]